MMADSADARPTAGLFEVREVDRRCFEEELDDFLPDRIIDVHTHVWLERLRQSDSPDSGRMVTWPSRVARENSIEDLLDTYRLMFPGRRVVPLVFPTVPRGEEFDAFNGYVSGASASHGVPALLFAHPRWPAQELAAKVTKGGFCGIKVYLDHAPAELDKNDIRIFDFRPHHQLEAADHHGWVVMLHIPRDGRLRDQENLSDMMEIETRYPRAKLIIAHVGRAYCPEDLGDAMRVLGRSERMCFDISANTSQVCFEELLRSVGPKRVLFGSDLPILRMRMRRICEGGRYVNLVPRGQYGDVSADPHMREVDGSEANSLTFFMYEELRAFKAAAENCGLTEQDIRCIFHDNSARLLSPFWTDTADAVRPVDDNRPLE